MAGPPHLSPRARVIVGWSLLIGSVVGLVVCMVLWLLNLISNRAMLGITLALSWLSLVFGAAEFLQVAHNRHEDT